MFKFKFNPNTVKVVRKVSPVFVNEVRMYIYHKATSFFTVNWFMETVDSELVLNCILRKLTHLTKTNYISLYFTCPKFQGLKSSSLVGTNAANIGKKEKLCDFHGPQGLD